MKKRKGKRITTMSDDGKIILLNYNLNYTWCVLEIPAIITTE